MIEKVKRHLKNVLEFTASSFDEIEQFRIFYLGKKGILNDLFLSFRELSHEDKKTFGKMINDLKTSVNDKIIELQKNVKPIKKEKIDDYSRSGFPIKIGGRHPLKLIENRIIDIFSQIGYSISEGSEIEDDWHNFTALNFPKHHPARDMQDTFFLEKEKNMLLRTHTSSVQVRYMEDNQPPIRILSPGRVFRNESISARSHCIFHQVEGLYIDKRVSFSDLKQTLVYFTEGLFRKSKIRLRPSFFPYTEPSLELDIYWGLETETDYRITKGTGWLEILGGGMVDPNVLENCNIDSTIYSGFAFGMGIERIAMLIYQIDDIRLFFENDIRFLKQFSSEL